MYTYMWVFTIAFFVNVLTCIVNITLRTMRVELLEVLLHLEVLLTNFRRPTVLALNGS